MSNRLSKLLALVLALMLVFSVSLFAVSAEESTEGAAESTAESVEESAAESAEESKAVSAEESKAATESSSSNIPWKLIITVAVIIVIVAVLFILTRTNTKLGQKIAKFFKDYKSELKKITWMSWKDLVKATATVLVILAVAAIFVGLLDWGFSSLVNLLSSIG